MRLQRMAAWPSTFCASLVVVGVAASLGHAENCYKAMIQDPTPFLGNGGETIVLSDGTSWKNINYQYLYLYQYHPTVLICPSEGKMILGKHAFDVVPSLAPRPKRTVRSKWTPSEEIAPPQK